MSNQNSLSKIFYFSEFHEHIFSKVIKQTFQLDVNLNKPQPQLKSTTFIQSYLKGHSQV